MGKHTLSEAARLTGKSRSTIHRKMGKGELSYEVNADGNRVVDTSELIRVFEELKSMKRDAVSETVSLKRGATQNETGEIVFLRDKIDMLEGQVKELREERQELKEDKKWLQGKIDGFTLALPAPQQKSSLLSWVNVILIGCGVVTTGVLVFVAWVLPHLG